MSLMDNIRSGTDSLPVQIVVGLIIFSFVGWGVGMSGTTTDEVASVNGEPVYGLEYGRAVSIAEQRYSSQKKGGLTEDDRAELRERVLQDMIRQRALVQEAQKLGLAVSNAEIAAELMTYEFLQDKDGKFDTRAYQNFLRRQGMTRAKFEEQLREQLLITKLQELVVLGASVSEAEVRKDWMDANTKVDLSFVRIRPYALIGSMEASDDEVATWLAEHEDAVKARYDRDLTSRYDVPEKVDVRMILLPVETDESVDDVVARMTALRARIEGGEAFAAVATEASTAPSAPQGGLIEGQAVRSLRPEIQQALEGLEVGQMSEVIPGETEVRLYELVAREAAHTIPFDEVRTDIARRLLLEDEAPTFAATVAEKEILPAWKEAGEAPEELISSYGLSLMSTGPITLDGSGAMMLRPPQAMLDAARDAEVGSVLPEVFEDNGDYWVGSLVSRIDPDLAAYEDQRERIREMTLLQKRYAFLEAYVDDVVARAVVKR